MATNEIPLPAFTIESAQQVDKQLWYSTVGRQVIGGTVASGEGALASGRVMGFKSATQTWGPYVDGDPDWPTAVGILLSSVDATSAAVPCNIIVGGTVNYDQIVGWDAAAATDLGAVVNTGLNYIKF